MRLVSIGLNDIRRFSHPVRVDGIDAGLNVLPRNCMAGAAEQAK